MPARLRQSQADLLPPLHCGDCRKVHVLSQENVAAWRVFLACRTQENRSEGVLLGLSNTAMWAQIDREKLTEPPMWTFHKVKAAESAYVERWSEREAADRKKREQEREREARRRQLETGVPRGYGRKRPSRFR